ncbi:MAG: hypothetical protein PVH21_02700 [Myxococcales bacterium]|jgi:hypothetical protein
MSDRAQAAEPLLRQLERWSPIDAELWSHWRRGLGADAGADVLALQAVLCGLAAFARLENQPDGAARTDPHSPLEAMHAAYQWALHLVERLQRAPCAPSFEQARQAWPRSHAEPRSSLHELRMALSEALGVSERALKIPALDSQAFRRDTDRFLLALERNRFFRPPGPLEFTDTSDLVGSERWVPRLGTWQSEAARTTILISLLTLLRTHRFLGIADRQIGERRGLHRAHIVVAGVRTELRAWSRFVLVQGVETFAEELEARLLSTDAARINRARRELGDLSRRLQRLRETVESMATEIYAQSCTALEQPLPVPGGEPGEVVLIERTRSGIGIVRHALKQAAKDLHRLMNVPEAERPERPRRRAERSLHRDIWAFRFILRAFIAKASVAPLAADDWHQGEDLEFVTEFVRHFRVFGPRLVGSTGYTRPGPLSRAISGLTKPGTIDAATLRYAKQECASFADHLDATLDRMPGSPLAPFDKRKAAAELRGYLAAAKARATTDRAAAAAFGLLAAPRMHAG